MIDVRAARPADAALIVGFIRALAEYEKVLHEVRIDAFCASKSARKLPVRKVTCYIVRVNDRFWSAGA